MTRVADREKARTLRAQGKSYSEIRECIGVAKGTLSVWLADMPLSAEQIRLLRDVSPKRIEHFRETMRKKRDARYAAAYACAVADIGHLTQRELFIAGLYLYWGEGTKSSRGTVAIANTDPAVIRAFLHWLGAVGIPRESLRARLHLYKDMDQKMETDFWSKETGLPQASFRKPYIKESTLSAITYKNGYGHGTCNVFFENIGVWEYITMALKHLREIHARSSMVEQSPYTRLVGGSNPSGRTKR